MVGKSKTLLVGLDAACWRYLTPLLEAERLPTLQRLLNEGPSGTLRSTMPAWTPTAWASLVTGKNPGKHGIFDMLWRRPHTYDFVPTSAQVRMGTPFWKHLNNQGLRVGLINVPFSYPLDSVNGFVVAGFGAPNTASDIAHPPTLKQWIRERFTDYEPTVDAKLLLEGTPEEVFRAERQHQARQVEIAVEMANHYDVDILVINLMFPDHANHKMPTMAQVQDAICESDKDLQTLLERFAPDNVMLISDHGSSRVKGNFLLQAWLRDHGYYVQAERAAAGRKDALNWVLMQWLRSHRGWSGPFEKLLRHLATFAIPRLPRGMAGGIWDKIEQVVPFAREHVQYRNQPDYGRTRVFPGSIHSGLLYFNLVGREPSGMVPPEEREALAAELAQKLAQIVDPDSGRPLFPGIYTARQLFTGAAADHAPDLILDTYGIPWNIQLTSYTPTVEQARDRYFVSGRDYGWHSQDGIFVFSGPAFTRRPSPAEYNLVDIPATLLYLYGVPIPEDFDGRVLTELITPEFVEQHPVLQQPGDAVAEMPSGDLYSAEEAEVVAEHLRALGYVE